ncbi:MAG: hypothetical protein ACE5D2_08615 [Fidelibacterota bacterium]
MLKITKILLPVLLIWSCATPYRPKGLLGGYSDKQVAEGVFEVRFEGNQHTSAQKVQTYLLYRSAELALEQGYPYFMILSDKSYQLIYSEIPEPVVPFRTVASMSGGVSTIANPDFGLMTQSSEPKGVYVIRLLKEKKPELVKFIVDAEAILNNFKADVK